MRAFVASTFAEAVWAVSHPHIPEEREDCLRLAETSLQSLRRDRMRSRQAEIEEELRTADPGQRAELYQKMLEISQAIDEDDRSKGVSQYE